MSRKGFNGKKQKSIKREKSQIEGSSGSRSTLEKGKKKKNNKKRKEKRKKFPSFFRTNGSAGVVVLGH